MMVSLHEVREMDDEEVREAARRLEARDIWKTMRCLSKETDYLCPWDGMLHCLYDGPCPFSDKNWALDDDEPMQCHLEGPTLTDEQLRILAIGIQKLDDGEIDDSGERWYAARTQREMKEYAREHGLPDLFGDIEEDEWDEWDDEDYDE